MSRYEIQRACGHVESVNITGTDVHGERGRRAEWEATRDCRGCWQAARLAATAPSDLTGTPKQIVWATDIRAGVAAAIEDLQQQMDTGVARHPEQAEQAAAVMAAVRDQYARHTDATWWIDHQGDAVVRIRADAVAALQGS